MLGQCGKGLECRSNHATNLPEFAEGECVRKIKKQPKQHWSKSPLRSSKNELQKQQQQEKFQQQKFQQQQQQQPQKLPPGLKILKQIGKAHV